MVVRLDLLEFHFPKETNGENYNNQLAENLLSQHIYDSKFFSITKIIIMIDCISILKLYGKVLKSYLVIIVYVSSKRYMQSFNCHHVMFSTVLKLRLFLSLQKLVVMGFFKVFCANITVQWGFLPRYFRHHLIL